MTDVVVVGSGAGGGVVASELALAGAEVVLLEKGPWIDLAKDSPLSRTAFEDAPHPLEPKEASYVADDPEAIGDIPLLRSLSRGRAVNPSGRRLPARVTLVNGVGGATLRYQGVARRLPLQGWPVGDLGPWYDRAERALDVGRFPPSHLAKRIAPAFARKGWTLEPAPLALLRGARGDRAACVTCGGCTYGCPTGAKSSVDHAWIRPAVAGGKLKVVPSAAAFRVEADGVRYHDAAGAEQRVAARYVVVSAGALETPRLLLNSGFGGPVGRGVTSSLYVSLTVLGRERLGSHRGPPMDGLCRDFEDRGFIVGVSQSVVNLLGPMAYARRLAPVAGHLEWMRRHFGDAIGLVSAGGAKVQDDNAVSLSTETDRRGVPKAKLRLRLHREDVDRMLEMRAALDAVAGGIDGTVEEVFTSYDRSPGGAELRGGCRMGTDPATSVVDPDLRVHGRDNVFVVDASVFPDAQSGNPSLTISALAIRAADHIRRLL